MYIYLNWWLLIKTWHDWKKLIFAISRRVRNTQLRLDLIHITSQVLNVTQQYITLYTCCLLQLSNTTNSHTIKRDNTSGRLQKSLVKFLIDGQCLFTYWTMTSRRLRERSVVFVNSKRCNDDNLNPNDYRELHLLPKHFRMQQGNVPGPWQYPHSTNFQSLKLDGVIVEMNSNFQCCECLL